VAFSKITLNGVTLMDVTQDNPTSATIFSGVQATGADGNKVQGSYTPYPDGDELGYGTLSDLTGTTWYFNEHPTISIELYLLDCWINFTSNSENYSNLMVEYKSQSVCAVTYDALGMYWNGAWSSEAYRTISITGGTDATNADLITWIQANATQVTS